MSDPAFGLDAWPQFPSAAQASGSQDVEDFQEESTDGLPVTKSRIGEMPGPRKNRDDSTPGPESPTRQRGSHAMVYLHSGPDLLNPQSAIMASQGSPTRPKKHHGRNRGKPSQPRDLTNRQDGSPQNRKPPGFESIGKNTTSLMYDMSEVKTFPLRGANAKELETATLDINSQQLSQLSPYSNEDVHSTDRNASETTFRSSIPSTLVMETTQPRERAYAPEPITATELYLMKLDCLVASANQLEKGGYSTKKLTQNELNLKKRCQKCSKVIGKQRPRNLAAQNLKTMERAPSASSQGIDRKRAADAKATRLKDIFMCRFHPGELLNKRWTCCGAPGGNPFLPLNACSGAKEHVALEYSPEFLERTYQLYETPPNDNALQAVAIDCEMGTAQSGDSELIRVSVIDYFTGKAVIDKLVFPTVPMEHLNTRFSGVSFSQLNKAHRLGETLEGTAAAREAVWKFVGRKTVVIAHAGCNDLKSLRWIHRRIIDTLLLEPRPQSEIDQHKAEKERRLKEKRERQAQDKKKKPEDEELGVRKKIKLESGASSSTETNTEDAEALANNVDDADAVTEQSLEPNPGAPAILPPPNRTEARSTKLEADAKAKPKQRKPKGSGPRALKTLAKVKLGRDIQASKSGHDSIEDALAARDLAHWTVLNGRKGVEDILKERGELEKMTEVVA